MEQIYLAIMSDRKILNDSSMGKTDICWTTFFIGKSKAVDYLEKQWRVFTYPQNIEIKKADISLQDANGTSL